MRKSFQFVVSLLLCLLLPLNGIVLAAQEQTLSIRTPEELLTLAERCRLDSYSRGLTVRLEQDLDMTGTEFSGIPSFSGTFDGNGHKITGFSLTRDGSSQGFFRYLTQEGRVENLTLCGTVCPAGSSAAVGGIAGSNAGRILRCRTTLQVSGSARVGGIAGENTVTGLIENCTASGSVSGAHFIGGIAGVNEGLIRGCRNESAVCTEPSDGAVDLSTVTLHTVTGAEAVTAVTDLGGIAGTNNGFIRSCQNHGSVGYPHVGFYVGGIAGSQKGTMESCRNFSPVSGRKEVGGIVGQLEPAARVDYEQDSLQILRGQLSQTIDLADQASANASGSAYAITSQIDTIRHHSRKAKEAAEEMVIRPGEPLPDPDQLKAASADLASNLTGMKDTTISLGHTTEAALTGITGDLRALVASMKTMQDTIDNVADNLGGTVTDVSDLDTEDDFTAEISGCRNDAAVTGDLNIGGIAGAIAQENDLDPEDDLQFSGSISLNFSGELRAVIRDCTSFGTISAKKWNAGGIVGMMALGLADSCSGAGTVDAAGADYVGGVAGRSAGFIRRCSAKYQLSARSWVGGVAGTAQIVTDCRSMAAIEGARERSGAVVGQLPAIRLKDELELRDNVYFPARLDPGGIDGISYEGAAVPLTWDAFCALPELSPIFAQVAVTFEFEDGSTQVMTVPTGKTLTQLPPVPEKEGVTLSWEGLSDSEPVYFDRICRLAAVPRQTTRESDAQRGSGRPVLLIEGLFDDASPFPAEPLTISPSLSPEETLLECWSLPRLPSTDSLRICLPEDADPALTRVYLHTADGWKQQNAVLHGSYLAVQADGQADAVALASCPAPFPWGAWLGGGAAATACILLAVWLLIRRRHKKS